MEGCARSMRSSHASRLYLFLVVCVASLGCSSKASPKTTGSLLDNPGFEEIAPNGLPRAWGVVPAYTGKGEAIVDTTTVHSGQHSFRITPKTTGRLDPFGVHTKLNVDIIKGNVITLTGYVKTKNIEDKGVAILLVTDVEQWAPLPANTHGRFTPFRKVFRVADSAPNAELLLLVAGKRGHAWFDDLRLVIGESNGKPQKKSLDPARERDADADKINTSGWQDSVYVSPDGSELYFAYLPYKQKDFLDLYFGRVSEQDIASHGPFRPGHHGSMNFDTYLAVRNENGTWGAPINLSINSGNSLYSAKLSHNGKELYYAIRDDPRNYGADDIYFSERLDDGRWSPPENLGPTINTKFREDTPCLSADGQTLWFARNKNETLGWEIMVSTRTNGKWGTARKLGPPINQSPASASANYQPFVTADSGELYFTRIQQLYVSRKSSEGQWQEPAPVFPQLPVSGHASVTSDGRYLYFLTAGDKESLRREHWTIWYAERGRDGNWTQPRPVD